MSVSPHIIDILIPTFNRAEFLRRNINYLINEIESNKINKQVRIIISDNCSDDNTQSTVEQLVVRHPDINLIYNRNVKNIGLEANMVKLLELASAPYVLWTGDDDFLDKGYVKFCIDEIENNDELGVIVTGILKEYEDGKKVKIREPGFERKLLDPGYETILKYSYLGHQLSGLLFKREGLVENYLHFNEYRNIYPFIFFLTDRMCQFQTLYIPRFRTTIPVFNRKYWEYNELGLLDEVFKAYYPFIGKFGEAKVGSLIIQFLRQQSAYRLGISYLKPIKLLKQYRTLIKKLEFTSWTTSMGIFIVLMKEYLLSLKRFGNSS
ncbi:glycosyltransferase family 2 protein [Fulvivirga ulvae]|uniref:glycosyltransferase family 2 protein n=1 Tax=Fulvivirga ulvae TaxID=2904245 RepID=UPI001F15902F|nr:glycosyltransferase family 2 protein [Fulvivirga ulvae]UII33373.1 glycosyltransferase family 2 protein [Fulvivirga ulvae]